MYLLPILICRYVRMYVHMTIMLHSQKGLWLGSHTYIYNTVTHTDICMYDLYNSRLIIYIYISAVPI